MSTDAKQVARHTLADEAPPMPGLVIRRDILDRLKLSQAEFARAMGISPTWFHHVLTGRSSISPEFALRLAKVTGTDPANWMDLQSRFNLEQESRGLKESLDKLVTLELRHSVSGTDGIE